MGSQPRATRQSCTTFLIESLILKSGLEPARLCIYPSPPLPCAAESPECTRGETRPDGEARPARGAAPSRGYGGPLYGGHGKCAMPSPQSSVCRGLLAPGPSGWAPDTQCPHPRGTGPLTTALRRSRRVPADRRVHARKLTKDRSIDSAGFQS